VPATWADGALLQKLPGYTPKTHIVSGVTAFVDWYRDYYDV
jgi:UDP-glucuronate 4-epimerase